LLTRGLLHLSVKQAGKSLKFPRL